jgi:F-type H+-transporting ATPase subunit b
MILPMTTLYRMTLHRMTLRKMTTSRAIARAILLALLTVACASVVSVRAQEQPQPAASEPNQAGSDSAQKSAQHPAQQAGGPGRQLVHGSNEAAGEEKDQFAEFKQSASVKGISRLTGLGLQQSYWLSLVLNFVIIAGAMIWAARKYLPGLFRDRTAAIQKAMQEARKASDEARARLAEIESRLMKLDSAIDAIRDSAEKEGAAEEARIKAAAEEEARKIVSAAEQEISAAAKAARRQLTAYAADLAVGLARKQIHVDAVTDQALVRNFAGQLGASEDSASGKDRN